MADKKTKRTSCGGGFGVLNQPAVTAKSAGTDQVDVAPLSQFADEIDDTREVRVKKFFKRNALLIGVSAAAVIVLIMAMNVSSSRSETLDKQHSEILSLEQSLETNTESKDADYAGVIRQATGGIDAKHRAEDEAAAEKLFRTALTWDGMSEYLDTRETVMRVYGLKENSPFMSTFMPGEIQGAVRTAPDGSTHYAHDADINSSYDGMDAVVTGVNGDVYSYWALVSMRVASDSGQTSTPMYATVNFDVVDGDIVNLTADSNPAGVQRTS